MSEPAVFVLIRDGQKRFFADRWAAAFLFRELIWGSEALIQWLSQSEEIDELIEEASGGVVVDYDRNKLVWYCDSDLHEVPRVASCYDRLLGAAWPEFDCQYATRGMKGIADAADEPYDEYSDDEYGDGDFPRLDYDGDSIDDFDEEEEYESDHEEFDDDEQRIWVTLIDRDSLIHHRYFHELPEPLLHGEEQAISELIHMDDQEVPSESVVATGLWIDQIRNEAGMWGGLTTRTKFPEMLDHWEGWSVKWSDNGYDDQCALSGPEGDPMSDVQALGVLGPILLSNKRFDFGTAIGMMGGQLQRTAAKLTGCLLMILCAPVVLFGLISGNLKAAGITIALVALVVILIFKLCVNKVKQKFQSSDWSGADSDERPPVVGPMDKEQRRNTLDALLQSAGFPSLKDAEKHFSKHPMIEDFV